MQICQWENGKNPVFIEVQSKLKNYKKTWLPTNLKAALKMFFMKCSTKGIIFHLASGNEISFEIGTWFSEMITIRRGYELVKSFTSVEEFLEDWEDSEGYFPECNREVKTIA